MRNTLLSCIFAFSATAASESYALDQGQNDINPDETAALSQQSPSGGEKSEYCTYIDGGGEIPDRISKKLTIIQTKLNRFPSGQTIYDDMEESDTILCFDDEKIKGQNIDKTRKAEYQREKNLMRLVTSETDVSDIVHEWKHKYDDIDFNSFKYNPHSATMLLRFAECGAYTFEAKTQYETKKYGVNINSADNDNNFEKRVSGVYEKTIKAGGSQEQAWRNGFDECFSIVMKDDIYTDIVLTAYEKALNNSYIRSNPNFAKTGITEEFLIHVALPPGWSVEAFSQTGESDILSNAKYAGYDRDDFERLQKILASIQKDESKGTQGDNSPLNNGGEIEIIPPTTPLDMP